ncbi:hypothetical protein [Rufibacter sp. LB8]|uniref:hypothetical protein n=1 Tax=Rufibacter sp. LB8 TaxID=2777781 RepID=UPI00178C6C1B|nr:hypothetical protein [Rufibacter sp. LB8]
MWYKVFDYWKITEIIGGKEIHFINLKSDLSDNVQGLLEYFWKSHHVFIKSGRNNVYVHPDLKEDEKELGFIFNSLNFGEMKTGAVLD